MTSSFHVPGAPAGGEFAWTPLPAQGTTQPRDFLTNSARNDASAARRAAYFGSLMARRVCVPHLSQTYTISINRLASRGLDSMGFIDLRHPGQSTTGRATFAIFLFCIEGGGVRALIYSSRPERSYGPHGAVRRRSMNEDVFNASIRKFLKTLGVTAQREIEKAVRKALDEGKLKGSEKFPAKATVTLAGIGLTHEVTGEIELE
jgi:hypothetical protein